MPRIKVFSIPSVVFTGGTKSGVVQFVGPTEFAAGNWVGVELDTREGKFWGPILLTDFKAKPALA